MPFSLDDLKMYDRPPIETLYKSEWLDLRKSNGILASDNRMRKIKVDYASHLH